MTFSDLSHTNLARPASLSNRWFSTAFIRVILQLARPEKQWFRGFEARPSPHFWRDCARSLRAPIENIVLNHHILMYDTALL